MTDACSRVLVVGGSPDVSTPETIRCASEGCTACVAIDRGLDALVAAGLPCSLFCGDCDTVSAEGAQLVAQGDFEVERYDPHKDDTDLGLALRAIKRRWPCATLVATCVSGGAADHNLAVLGRLCGYEGDVTIIEDDFEARILHAGDTWTINDSQGSRFSCIPLSPVADVTESGFRWNLDHALMEFLSDWGISNVVEDSQAKVTCHEGTLSCWLYREP